MLRMLEAQAPAKQTATDTISTLSSRLTSATLLEDRRAAILGLRSFAKEYPASVASGALHALISCLTRDAEDVDTIKVVLETLLMLFNPNENSPEASDEIALWLADSFTQRQDNITILLDLLENPDFYSRLYSLQLIQAISSARPERTQECVLTAPLGMSRLVATLDDTRDAVRNAGLILLNDLSQSSTDLQKLIVFENAFDRVFNLIQTEGSLTQGGIVVQDCLSLLANLVRYNASNQTTFRETGGAARFAALLPGAPKSKKTKAHTAEEDDWTSPQKDKNIWGLLAILRMFLVTGSKSTLPNQNAFQKHGILQQALNMAFDKSTTIPIKVEALYTCADMIRGNQRLQEGFAQLQVTPIIEQSKSPNGDALPNGVSKVYIIDALLDLALSPASNELFDARFAACECIKAYFFNHVQIRHHFLKRAIDGHISGQDETANVLSTLITGPQGSQTIDPYRTWFAASLVFHLVFEDREAKHALMQVSEGDAERGEEVVTCIQALTSNLIASLQVGEDERVLIGYLMLLCGWLFEEAGAVNDFLGEGSSLQSLVQAASKPGNDQVVIRGLCAALLGIIYEFSTKDSPISRRELQPILTISLGRERYLDAITRLRQHPLVRDFEVLPHDGSSAHPGGLPEVYFDTTFVDFLKDNFSRLSRAIDRDPGLEIHQSHDGVDRDLVDSLRGQLEEKIQALEKAQSDILTIEQKLNQEKADHRRTQESSLTQLNTIKRINEDLHKNHEADVKKLEREHKQTLLDIENKHGLQLAALNNKLQQAQKDISAAVASTKMDYEDKLQELYKARDETEKRLIAANESRQQALETIHSFEKTQQRTKEEIGAVQKTITALQTDLTKSVAQVKELKEEKTMLQDGIEKLKAENRALRTDIQDQTWKVKDAEEKSKKMEEQVKEKEEARSAVQTELDDLFVVLGDLEEKRMRDKQRLKALGEEVSDVEDEEDGDDDDNGEDEENAEEKEKDEID
ncbi:intracellular protein transport protein-like protein [Lepidopterella palustris CBS 459.81]|uniref:Intracellular protein transport protein-like protein n=1 Tax=Lepidopterella palustris CBS 459.81 TaxID=1314670 RepID=A0A8E2ED12_9PEZI|nr:intracellular protein transport protein-like protein [Lepidopterella palustris CBS 459.81]